MNHQDLLVLVGGMFIVSLIIYGIVLIAFGQITVRKLRRNPQTRGRLGLEFMSGWDIMNVSAALNRPEWLSRRIDNGPWAAMHANSALMRRHTTRLDRVLARAHLYSLCFAAAWVAAIIVVTNLD